MQTSIIATLLLLLAVLPRAFGSPSSEEAQTLLSASGQDPATVHRPPRHGSLRSPPSWNPNISKALFAELEELARIVDISYCVGTTGISKPFLCASRCTDFPNFELVDTWSTGVGRADSCGFMAVEHARAASARGGGVGEGRIIVAFRGTYSLADTILDLSTVPQAYVPFPDDPDEDERLGKGDRHRFWDMFPRFGSSSKPVARHEKIRCSNCTVHSGFWSSWQSTRDFILPHIEYLTTKYPDYRIHLVGHSLGGAVAALAGLEFEAKGWKPVVTTFGEPRVGNAGMRDYVDEVFRLPSEHLNGSLKWSEEGRYRRLTHVDDPVPLLPLQEWGYRPHAGEIYISKASLQPGITDIRRCLGDEDVNCLASAESGEGWFRAGQEDVKGFREWIEEYENLDDQQKVEEEQEMGGLRKRWGIPIPARYKMWQLFFAHRDYFWRLGLCVPGGDPLDWGRGRYDFGGNDGLENGDGKIEEHSLEREGREDL